MDTLDEISLGVFSYLKNHPRVSHLDHKTFVGASSAQLLLWEQKHAPVVLPDDLKRFYTITNGLSVKWFADLRAHPTLVGHFALNAIQDLHKIKVEHFTTRVRPSDHHRLDQLSIHNDSVIGFLLESMPQYGGVVLLFFADDQSQIWFRDLQEQWSFLTTHFVNYHRMMIAHLGIISWQTIFSDMEMDPFRKPWFYLFIPQRMIVNAQEEAETKATSTSRLPITHSSASHRQTLQITT